MIWHLIKSLIPALIFLGAASLFAAWMKSTKGRRGERAVHRAITDSGAECITDFILPDGRGGLTQVDHVIKLPVGVAVIETKNYSGKIYGREGEPTWTQVIGGQKNKFQNPIRQNFAHTEAIKLIVGKDVEVFGQVIFVGDARFKQMPEGVSGARELKKHLRLVAELPIPAAVEQGWQALQAAMVTDPESRKAHLIQVKDKKEQFRGAVKVS